MGLYDEPKEKCPYCGDECNADFVDNGVGMVQCGPYHCFSCGASEIGPELWNWYLKDREGKRIYLTGKRVYSPWQKKKIRSMGTPILPPDAPFTAQEIKTCWYNPAEHEKPVLSPYANTVNGELVDNIKAKEAYNVGMLDEKHI